MNRYRAGGPSKATPTTTCQKCLKKGHYSYECTASKQDRPYISRPSRTQQLLNPKLVPKLTNDAPKDLAPKLTASEIIKKDAAATGRKRGRDDESDDRARKRSRSVSSSSSFDSISSISTNRSRSRSPPARGDHSSKTPQHEEDRRTRRRSPASPPRGSRRRSPLTSPRRSRSWDRDTQRRPERDSRSRSPYGAPPAHRASRDLSPPRRAPASGGNRPPAPRDRSLSPFSKRKALSMANR